ncbi:MAG: hypothetical protein BWY19_00296 [bacterium ADurb.Bin212]|nr:MAG: hypothetical protein BWY19_00296 [bacterium ADurb.Bin212]
MKSYSNLNELITDFTKALQDQDNDFSKEILRLLRNGPENLVREYHEHPDAKMTAKNGDWLYLWSGGVKIDKEIVSYKRFIEKIEELLRSK